MNENKEYVSQVVEGGIINISEEVVATIAALAISEAEGVGGLSANLGTDIAELLGKKNLSRGVKLNINEGVVTIDCFIQVKYGYAVPEVAKNVQEAVAGAVESMTGLTIEAVNVNIGGVTFDKVK